MVPFQICVTIGRPPHTDRTTGIEVGRDGWRPHGVSLCELLSAAMYVESLDDGMGHVLLVWDVVRLRLKCVMILEEEELTVTTRHPIRKRVNLRVPSEKCPEYIAVWRLLGLPAATIKRMQHDTGCRIMICGKGSICKDKEAEVRCKPGYEHVFNDPLHVVIEVVDVTDEAILTGSFTRAKELVEMLLIPTPEELYSLNRVKIRDPAILSGTLPNVPNIVAQPQHQLQHQHQQQQKEKSGGIGMSAPSPLHHHPGLSFPLPSLCLAGPVVSANLTSLQQQPLWRAHSTNTAWSKSIATLNAAADPSFVMFKPLMTGGSPRMASPAPAPLGVTVSHGGSNVIPLTSAPLHHPHQQLHCNVIAPLWVWRESSRSRQTYTRHMIHHDTREVR